MLRKKDKVLYPELSYQICGLCFKIHNELGRFRNEKQYADAFEQGLIENNISYEREKEVPVSFNGENPRRSIIDFLIDDKIIIEFKTRRLITKEDYFQVKRYLASSNKELGILVNF